MRSHARASDERQLQVKTLPQHLRRDSRLAASMPGCGCPSPPRGRRVWWLSLGVQSRPHLRPSARYAFGRPFCFIIFFFPFPRNTLRFSRISHDLIIWKKCMSCYPKDDSRGPTLELNFSSAIWWIQARVALPFAQTTSGEQGRHFVSGHVKLLSPRMIRIERENSSFPLYFDVKINCRFKISYRPLCLHPLHVSVQHHRPIRLLCRVIRNLVLSNVF